MTDTTITIGGREFRVGARYAPSAAALLNGPRSKPRIFRGWSKRRSWMVRCDLPTGNARVMRPDAWLLWAGDEVAA